MIELSSLLGGPCIYVIRKMKIILDCSFILFIYLFFFEYESAII